MAARENVESKQCPILANTYFSTRESRCKMRSLREVCVMKSYHPKLLRVSTATARIRSEIFDVLV
jgi:hypothetical protein